MTNAGQEPGEWLKTARSAAGYATAAEFARAIEVERYTLSTYETGKSKPSDETAKKIADALQLPIIEVRRGLGLWVPDENRPQPEEPEESLLDRATRLEELARSLLDELQEKEQDRQKRQKRRPTS